MTRPIVILPLLLLAACSRLGNIPNNANDTTLGGDLGGGPGAAVVSQVGGVAAADVATSAKAVENATGSAVAATLVKRDAAGNFAANTITGTLIGNASTATSATTAASATFALGKRGTDIASTSVLTLPTDGGFFLVTGGSDISSLSAAPAGARVKLMFSGTARLMSSSNLILSGQGSYRVSPADTFDFVSGGAGAWLEVARKVSKDSRVFASTVAGQPLPSGVLTQIVWGDVAVNTQNEYNGGTGVFTANQSGLYLVQTQYFLAPVNWVANSFCEIAIVSTSGPIITAAGTPLTPGGAGACFVSGSATLPLAVGDQIYIEAAQNSGALTTLTANASTNNLTITRLRP